MTVRTNAVQVCDRCEKPFNEKHLKSGDAVPVFKQKGLVITEMVGTSTNEEPGHKLVCSFDDMCPKCQKAVDELIKKIKMDSKTPKKKRGAAKKRGAKSKEKDPPKPPVTEYSEAAQAEIDQDKATARAKNGTEQSPGESDSDAPPPEEATEPADKPKSDAEAAGRTESAEGSSEGGNGTEAASEDDDALVTDPNTGDKYDPTTGEVVSRGTNGGKHPF